MKLVIHVHQDPQTIILQLHGVLHHCTVQNSAGEASCLACVGVCGCTIVVGSGVGSWLKGVSRPQVVTNDKDLAVYVPAVHVSLGY